MIFRLNQLWKFYLIFFFLTLTFNKLDLKNLVLNLNLIKTITDVNGRNGKN